MDEDKKYELATEILCSIINNHNIVVKIANTHFTEVTIHDKEKGTHILLGELLDHLVERVIV
jgi:hypothetical protein